MGVSMALNDKMVTVEGLPVHYWEDGAENSRVIFLLHGGLGDAEMHWKPVIPMLAETFHVYAPDLPGFGKSGSLPRLTTEAMLNWIQSLLGALHIDQTVMVGNSFGGVLVRLFAAGHPKYIPAVILVNGGGVPEVPPALKTLAQIPGVSTLLFMFLGRMATSPGMLKSMIATPDILTESFQAKVKQAAKGFTAIMRMLTTSPMPQAQRPIVPSLILWGTEDQFTPLSEAKAIKASIPDAALIEISECGHMPQLETPDVFVWQINQFLDKLSRPARNAGIGPQPLANPPS